MRLEYVPDGSPDSPLIRLFDFIPWEAARLGAAVAGLAGGRADRLAVHELPGVVPAGGCALVFRVRTWDQGVRRLGPAAFECGFTSATWDIAAGLVEPSAARAEGFQWLAGVPGEASLLLSPSGPW